MYYEEALKRGKREYHRDVARGQYPFLPVLDELLPHLSSDMGLDVGLTELPIELVIGTRTSGRTRSFARNFMPLADGKSEFGSKWKQLCMSHLEEGIHDPVKVWEYKNRFYVEEGNKRVSVLKFFGAVSVPAYVRRILPPRDGDPETERYYQFLDFCDRSGLNDIELSDKDAYARLLAAVSGRGQDPWTEEERKDFSSACIRFSQAYRAFEKRDPMETGIPADALFAYIQACGYPALKEQSPDQIRKEMARLWRKEPAGERILHQIRRYSPVRVLTGISDRLAEIGMRTEEAPGRGRGEGSAYLPGHLWGRLPGKTVHLLRRSALLLLGRGGSSSPVSADEKQSLKVLLISDEISRQYYDFYQPGMLSDIDLIISCGDLPSSYLEFLVTMAGCPLLYVHGNHDEVYLSQPPTGCICIEDRIFTYKGIRFLGLGGSQRYRPDGAHMYTEKQMHRRIGRLRPALLKSRGFDVLVTHAPARGYGDLKNLPHRGFVCFLELLDRYHPAYLLHGHVHRNYAHDLAWEYRHGRTRIINAFSCRVLEIGL